METNRYTLKDSYIDVLDSAFVEPGSRVTRSGDFSIFYLNVRGLNSKFEELLSLLKSFTKLPDCVVLVETWLHPDVASYFNISGYTAYHLFRSNRRGGGISIFLSNKVSQSRPTSTDVVGKDLELLKINFKIGNSPHCLFSIYRPPSGDIGTFLSQLEDSISTNPNTNKFLVGDFNIDLFNSSDFGPAFKLKELLVSYGYTLNINQVTRPKSSTDSGGTLIDHIWTNFDLIHPMARVIDYQLSDHFPLTLSFFPSNASRESSKTKIKFRNINSTNVEKFKSKLHNLNLDFLAMDGDVCDKWTSFASVLSDNFQACCPIKIKTTDNKDKAPWFNQDIRSLIKQKHCMYRLLVNQAISKNVYKQFCNKVTYCIRKRKNEYYANLYQNQFCSKNKWNVLKQHIGHFKSNENISEIKSLDGVLITDSPSIASTFNSYFSSVGDRIADSIPVSDTSFREFLTSPNSHSFYFYPTTAVEIENIISSLKNTAPQNIDEIPVRLLKTIKSLISPYLSTLINESVQSGIVPPELKTAKIIPLHKNGDKLLLNNYRPISLLPAMSKIFEKVMHHRISTFLEKYNRLSPSQFGFRSSRDTSSALQVILHNIYSALDQKLLAANVYLDFSKAFDTVPHDIILTKLEHHGIRGSTLDWFRSYLSGRSQYVSLGEVRSTLCPINRGVLQGSILGPLLFIIMINDMFCCHDLKMISYADDTTLAVDASSAAELHTKITTAINKVCRWTNANKLKLNISKTKYTIFTGKKNCSLGPICVGGQVVSPCFEYKILGLILDAALSFRAHAGKVCRRLAFCTHVLRRLGSGVSKKVRTIIYNSYADPHIRYCLEFYGYTFKKYTNHIIKHQRSLFKLIDGRRDHPSGHSGLAPALGLLSYEALLNYKISCIVFGLVRGHFGPPLSDTINSVSKTYNLRNVNDLELPLIRIEKTKRSIHWIGPKVWNSIPYHIRQLPFCSFKKELKLYLSKKY